MFGPEQKSEYITFIEDQLSYFDAKSIHAKKIHNLFSIGAIVANAIIPIINVLVPSVPTPDKIAVTVVSSISAILTGTGLALGTKGNWQHYRNCFTDLEKVVRAYKAGAGNYKGLNKDDAFELFYDECESVLSSDRHNWGHISIGQ